MNAVRIVGLGRPAGIAACLVALGLVLLAACGGGGGGVALVAGASEVQASEANPPRNAHALGELTVVDGEGCGAHGQPGSQERAVAQLRNRAVLQGATYIQLKGFESPKDATHCNEVRARAQLFTTRDIGAALNIAAPQPSSTSAPRKATPVRRKGAYGAAILEHPLPEAPETAQAAEVEQMAPPSHALGYTKPIPGCLSGNVYPQAAADHKLPDDYGAAVPVAEVWGCEWNFERAPLAQAIPGGQAGSAYAVRYQGTFAAPSSGTFNFGVQASTAVRITIDGAVATGLETGGKQSGGVYLGSGKHQVLIEYLAAGNEISLGIQIQAPGQQAPSAFSTRKGSPFSTPQGVAYTGAAGSEEWQSLVHVSDEQLELTGQIYFQRESAELNREGQSEEALLAVAKTLKEQPRLPCIEVQGHTDARGNPESNLRLSRQRAATVRRWLVDAGTPPHKLVAKGFGGTLPLADNASEDGRAKNRRVQFLITKSDARGACPGAGAPDGDAQLTPRPHQVAPELARAACERRDSASQRIQQQLSSWIAEHQTCEADDDCAQTVPLECPGRHKALACSWVLVNQSSIEPLRVQGARLDSMHGLCDGLPEDDLVRSCGGCASRSRSCREHKCQYLD